MALIIKATENLKINISGTELELTEVYARLEFVAKADGATLEIYPTTYVSKATFNEGRIVSTNTPTQVLNFTIEPTEQQSLETAHNYAKTAYEQLGYEVIIDLI